jgi:hypothetical protein
MTLIPSTYSKVDRIKISVKDSIRPQTSITQSRWLKETRICGNRSGGKLMPVINQSRTDNRLPDANQKGEILMSVEPQKAQYCADIAATAVVAQYANCGRYRRRAIKII